MPRDGTKNLIPLNKRTKEQQKEIARKGGIASQKKQKERKTFKEQFLILLKENPNLQMELINAHIERCKKKGERSSNAGNSALELLLKIIGEAPVEETKTTIEVEDMTPIANMLGLGITKNESSENPKD